jgi:phosphoribosylformimino-5-aminoimidazole carboxamide ribotide isomerase
MAWPSAVQDAGQGDPAHPPPVTHSWTRTVVIVMDIVAGSASPRLPSLPRVIPVLDLQAGRAVHAVGGNRAHYEPLRSVLHESSDPIGLARAGRDALGLREMYLADLDAIAGAAPAAAVYRALGSLGIRLWVDAGVRDAASLPPLLDAGVATIIVGLETVRGPAALAEVIASPLLDRSGAERLVFSLDVRGGVPLFAAGADWGTDVPLALAESVVAMGLRRILLLDLARVGTGRGPGTLPLLARLAAAHPEVELIAGGGIAGADDLIAAARAGAAAALVGSALHDGRIGAADLVASYNR